jgi:phosphoenolpyruvate carboxykinase (GTP)
VTPIGNVPALDSLDLDGLDGNEYDEESLRAVLQVDPTEWATETQSIEDWYASIGAEKLPEALRQELAELRHRLNASQ